MTASSCCQAFAVAFQHLEGLSGCSAGIEQRLIKGIVNLENAEMVEILSQTVYREDRFPERFSPDFVGAAARCAPDRGLPNRSARASRHSGHLRFPSAPEDAVLGNGNGSDRCHPTGARLCLSRWGWWAAAPAQGGSPGRSVDRQACYLNSTSIRKDLVLGFLVKVSLSRSCCLR